MEELYSGKLKDPRWRKKRAAIIERDNRKCKQCGGYQHLEVHHKKYTGEPWEAPDEDLETLCLTCHQIVEQFKKLSIFNSVTLLSIQKLVNNYGDKDVSYSVVLAETKGGERVIVFYEHKDGKIEIVLWCNAFNLLDLIQNFKTIKSHISNGKTIHG